MDLIYTNSKLTDQGVLDNYAFDLSFGESENDFELILGINPILESGAMTYIEGTEYGGIVDGRKATTNGETITYVGRTWHGILNSKIIEPDTGEDYLVVSGDANEVMLMLVNRLGLGSFFSVASELSGINISKYQFSRYCKGYDGIVSMLLSVGAKLKMKWVDRSVCLCALPIVDYTEYPVDGDTARLSVEQYEKKVNHLICLGKGDLAEREVIHLYVDQFGRIGDVQYYTGLDEITEKYDNSNSEDLRSDGIKNLLELRDNDKAEISIDENETFSYDIGDIVGSTEMITGVSVAASVSQKIIKINNGSVTIEYKMGG